jgi:hypothetical protein
VHSQINRYNRTNYAGAYTRRPIDGVISGAPRHRSTNSKLKAAPAPPIAKGPNPAYDEHATLTLSFTVPAVVHNKLVPSIRRYPYMWAFGTALGLILLMFVTILLMNGVHLLWNAAHKQPVVPAYLPGFNLRGIA